jgi:hypothetical protein
MPDGYYAEDHRSGFRRLVGHFRQDASYQQADQKRPHAAQSYS